MTVPPVPVPKPFWLRAKLWLYSPAGRRVEIAVIAYLVALLEKKGWLPPIPLPKA